MGSSFENLAEPVNNFWTLIEKTVNRQPWTVTKNITINKIFWNIIK